MLGSLSLCRSVADDHGGESELVKTMVILMIVTMMIMMIQDVFFRLLEQEEFCQTVAMQGCASFAQQHSRI